MIVTTNALVFFLNYLEQKFINENAICFFDYTSGN